MKKNIELSLQSIVISKDNLAGLKVTKDNVSPSLMLDCALVSG